MGWILEVKLSSLKCESFYFLNKDKKRASFLVIANILDILETCELYKFCCNYFLINSSIKILL